MEKKLLIIMTPFTGVGLHGGYRGDVWFKQRIEIFRDTCLKSLLNQTNRNFIHWISLREEERTNPLVQDLVKEIEKYDYPAIITYDNLMYWDDKFTDYSFKTMARNLLMMFWDCYKYKELKNPFKILKWSVGNKNKTLLQRVGKSLANIKTVTGGDYDWIYLTRIDSDDMFAKDAMAEVIAQEPAFKKALIFLKGYAWNLKTGQFADWKSPVDANPPYHTIIFPGKVFFDPQKHVEYYGGFKSHEDIPRVFNPSYLSDNKYCFTIHGKNIGTSWTSYLMKIQNSFIYHEYTEEERNNILKDFGII